MKSRPILFNSEMVRAILEGRKTQTRRPMKPQPKWVEDGGPTIGTNYWNFKWAYVFDSGDVHTWDEDGIGGQNWNANRYPEENKYTEAFKRAPSGRCPFGYIGDHLWVRETFHVTKGAQRWQDGTVLYRADPGFGGTYYDLALWRPSIHMPRELSRITLEITDIQVERVQDISERDACKDGGYSAITRDCKRPKFQALWNSVYKNWDENPWVWVIEFKKVEPV